VNWACSRSYWPLRRLMVRSRICGSAAGPPGSRLMRWTKISDLRELVEEALARHQPLLEASLHLEHSGSLGHRSQSGQYAVPTRHHRHGARRQAHHLAYRFGLGAVHVDPAAGSHLRLRDHAYAAVLELVNRTENDASWIGARWRAVKSF